MRKIYVLYQGEVFYSGGSYTYCGGIYPTVSSEVENAKVYKSKKRLENLIRDRKIPPYGGRYDWKILEIEVVE